jgi:hypothetical protein
MQAPGQVIISYEMVHDTRVIYTTAGRTSARASASCSATRAGTGRATLVIETTNLTDRTSIGLNGNGLRHSEEMVMTERITRVGADELRYEITMNDPKTYTKRSRSRCR